MSIYNCHKQQPQPWMSYIASNMICYMSDCCPALVTDTTSLLPFQVISLGSLIKIEISPYRENDWSLITIPYTEVYIGGYYFISYNGAALAEALECGAYDFKLTAGETWYFEPITVKDFEITENAYTIRDDLMLPFKFSEQQFETTPLIAPCDSFLPFMFSTENSTSGTVTVYLYDVVADCVVTELTDIVVTVLTVSGKTYYIHEGDCFYPFLECGTYKLEIVDGTHSYFSVPFSAVCDMNDIPDGYRALKDFNGCVMRDIDGDILTEECADVPSDINYGNLYDWYVVDDARNICAAEWHVPNWDECWTLCVYLDAVATFNNNTAGGHLKEAGIVTWNTPNTDADNSTGFNGRAAGQRSAVGVFQSMLIQNAFWNSNDAGSGYALASSMLYINHIFYTSSSFNPFPAGGQWVSPKNNGHSIRPIKDFTTLINGQTGTYLGNDGKVYRTICIGTQEWVADNLCETKYRNGDTIPEVTDNAAWAALVTGALCAYNNDWDNV
jgi:uncharacterized protein (TIGR02145 family)